MKIADLISRLTDKEKEAFLKLLEKDEFRTASQLDINANVLNSLVRKGLVYEGAEIWKSRITKSYKSKYRKKQKT